MKLVINDKGGKSFGLEIDAGKAGAISGKSIGDVINASVLGLDGYELKITGGSDSCGFPMSLDVPGPERKNLFIITKKGGVRERVRHSAKIVNDQTAQVNLIVVKSGSRPLEELCPKTEKKDKDAKSGKTPAKKK